MDKQALLEKIKSGNYTKEQLIGWITALPGSSMKVKPNEYKAGDVLMHQVFKHPFVLLKKRKEDWICGLLTSEENFPDILEPCNSRFFSKEYFVKSLFTASEIQGTYMGNYDNPKHIREVLIKLKQILL